MRSIHWWRHQTIVIYVRGRGSKKWHWHRNCIDYPEIIEESRYSRPVSELCIDCSEKNAVME